VTNKKPDLGQIRGSDTKLLLLFGLQSKKGLLKLCSNDILSLKMHKKLIDNITPVERGQAAA
jgi:hypothetical protein